MVRRVPFSTRISFLVLVLTLALAGSQVARAQFPSNSDIGLIDYFANANTAGAPDATVRIVNPGQLFSLTLGTIDAQDLCALIYVFDANQQMSECCGCFISANGLLTLSVNKNLTSNPLLGTRLKTGVIITITDLDTGNLPAPDNCDHPTSIHAPTQFTQRSVGLRSWATHIDNKVGTAYPVLLGESQLTFPSSGELNDLAEDCTVLKELGSGAGVCTCPPGH
jgi:hypothetical protein